MKEFNVKRHYKIKHAKEYNNLTGSEHTEKRKKLQAALASQQQLFTRTCEANESVVKASYEVAILITKYGKTFTERTFGVTFDYVSLACEESTDASDTTQLLQFFILQFFLLKKCSGKTIEL